MDIERQTVYIESTIPSYAAARTSRDVITAGKQALTKMFWDNERQKYDLITSVYTYGECSLGDAEAAKKRLDFLRDIPVLPETDEIIRLAAIYQSILKIPEKAKMDSFHLAVCVTARIDYLLSWNCRHLGIVAYLKIKMHNDSCGLWTPILTTPEALTEIMGDDL